MILYLFHNKQFLFFVYIKNIYSFSDIPDFLYFLAAILDFWHYYLSDHAKIWYDNVLSQNKQLLFFMYIKIIYSFSDIPDFLYFLAAILVSMAAILDFQNFKILLSACISRAVRGHSLCISKIFIVFRIFPIFCISWRPFW